MPQKIGLFLQNKLLRKGSDMPEEKKVPEWMKKFDEKERNGDFAFSSYDSIDIKELKQFIFKTIEEEKRKAVFAYDKEILGRVDVTLGNGQEDSYFIVDPKKRKEALKKYEEKSNE